MTTVLRSSGKIAIIGLLFLMIAASGGTMLRHNRINWLGTAISAMIRIAVLMYRQGTSIPRIAISASVLPSSSIWRSYAC